MIYLDNAATTFPKPEQVYDVVDKVQRTLAVNAGRGSYKAAREASNIINDARKRIAELVKIQDESRVVITPSSTIAMNQILNGLRYFANTNVYISPFEHNAVVRPLYKISKEYGFSINLLPFDSKTQELDVQSMKNIFVVKHPDIVVLNHVSNVTGLILPIDEIFAESKKYNAVNVLDASQSMGMLPVEASSDIDFLVFAGHKNLYSNFGVGGFVYNSNTELVPVITGGTGSDSLNHNMPETMPVKYEAASHDVIAIASLNTSLEWLMDIGVESVYNHKKQLTEYLIDGLSKIKSIKMYIPSDLSKHIAVVSITHRSYRPEELAEILDGDFDIAVRSGYHCAPFVHDLIGTKEGNGTVRISLGFFNDRSDVDALISALDELE
mgnify:FL=1